MMKRRGLAVLVMLLLLISSSGLVYASPVVSVGDDTVEPGVEIQFTVSNPPQNNSAWIGLFRYQPNEGWWTRNWDEADITYRYFRDIGSSGTFTMPYEEGTFIIGVFAEDGSADIPVAQSALIYSDFKTSMSISTQDTIPGQDVTFSYTMPPVGNNAWISLFPYEPNAGWWTRDWDEANLDYFYLRDVSQNTGKFSMPEEPGDYIIALFSEDTNSDIPLVQSGVIHSEFKTSLTIATQTPAPGSALTFSYTNPPIRSDAWISLFPYQPNAGWWTRDWDEANMDYYYLRDLPQNTGTFPMPSESGQYIIGIFKSDTSGSDIPIIMSNVITVGGSGSTGSSTTRIGTTSTSTGTTTGTGTSTGTTAGSGMTYSDGVLTGYVFDKNTMVPISNMQVTLYSDGYSVAAATTDANGMYTISVAEGLYLVEYSGYGYPMVDYEDIPIYAGETLHLDIIVSTPYY